MATTSRWKRSRAVSGVLVAERAGGASSGTDGGGGADGSAEVRRLRRRIDTLDRRIVRLIDERTALALEIGELKRAAGAGVRDAQREEEVLERVAEANAGPFPRSALLSLYRRLIATTRRVESAGGGRDRTGG